MVDLSEETEVGPLVLGLAGRLKMGDRVLPAVPATVVRGGLLAGPTCHENCASFVAHAAADVTWRETALQSMRRRVR